MEAELKRIAPLVSRQFPAFYREEGSNFVQFIKAYYEWLDAQGPVYQARRFLETYDVDETASQFVDYFLTKYMYGIPKNILADKRLLEKHILDIYRSKGSVEGLKLLFRLLYNTEIIVYTPYQDMLIASGGKWVRKKYLEVEERDSNPSYNRKTIRGTTSGATAFITSATKIYTGTVLSHLFYIDDVYPGPSGTSFIIGEPIVYDGLDIKAATVIKGSAVGATVIESAEDFSGGDIISSNNVTGEGLKFEVASLKDATQLNGYIDFKIVDGGTGYAVNSVVTIVGGANSTGTGASFRVGSISNTSTFDYNNNWLEDHQAVLIGATSYGANLFNANSQSVINNALTYANIEVGTIASLTGVTSGDANYNGFVVPSVFDRRVAGYGIYRSDSTLWGNNAIITGKLATGNGVINSVRLLSSGYGYNDLYEQIDFVNEANSNLTATMQVVTGAIGYEEGEWADQSGFLNADKYLTDSNYYQEYSYEIQVERSLDKYIDVLKQVMHPVGNRVFGKPLIIDSNQLNIDISVDTITVT